MRGLGLALIQSIGSRPLDIPDQLIPSRQSVMNMQVRHRDCRSSCHSDTYCLSYVPAHASVEVSSLFIARITYS